MSLQETEDRDTQRRQCANGSMTGVMQPRVILVNMVGQVLGQVGGHIWEDCSFSFTDLSQLPHML